MKTNITLSLLTAIAITLIGCGGAGDTPGTTTGNSGQSGNVGDGYIQGAYVCHDSDNDMDCLDETYATTDANGAFVLSNYDASQDLLVQIPVGAVDNGPFADGSTTPRPFAQPVWYYYPAQAAPANGPIFIGPLSTLVYAQTQNVPGISTEDAVNSVASSLGIQGAQVLGNYLEDSSAQGSHAHFVGELVGASLANYPATVTPNTYDLYLQDILANSDDVATTATDNNPATYDTTTYNAAGASGATPQGGIIQNFTPVTDLCSDLQNGTYFSFEDWDPAGNFNREHKTLFMLTHPVTGEQTIQTQWQVENNNAWSIDQMHTTTETAFLQDIEGLVIDMQHVNDTTIDYTAVMHSIPFPATNTACNGGNATFHIGAAEYKLYVSEMDISGLTGAQLPKGPSLDPLINSVTFGTGDKLYKALTILQNDAYVVKKGTDIIGGSVVPSPASQYLVYDDSYALMPSSNDITAMAQTVGTSFVVNYTDANNYEKITLTSTPASNGTGTADAVTVSGGTAQPAITMSYTIETHNQTPFLVVKNYFGTNADLFIGRVDAADSANFVFGSIARAGKLSHLTEGGFQNGDVMDDIMLNTSARDRVLADYNTQNNLSIPTPSLP